MSVVGGGGVGGGGGEKVKNGTQRPQVGGTV